MKSKGVESVLLLVTVLLAAYQVAAGIEGLGAWPITAYTIGFGVLLVSALMMLILGMGAALESQAVVIASTLIPVSLSLGLVWQHAEPWQGTYGTVMAVGFVAVLLTRALSTPLYLRLAALALTHGISGLVIFILPLALVFGGQQPWMYGLVGVGGGLIGLQGLLLAAWRAGHTVINEAWVLRALPWALALSTALFVVGF